MRSPARWTGPAGCNVARFGLVFVASCLAALINPYGWDLYRHVGNLLVSSGVTSLIQEYQPAPFGTTQACTLEIVLLAIGRVAGAREPAHGPLSARPPAGLAASRPDLDPQCSRCLPWRPPPRLPACSTAFRSRSGMRGRGKHGRSIWAPALAMGLLALTATGVRIGGFGETRWPLSALATSQPASRRRSRLFHEQDWGGLIEAECQPRRLSYMDDRFELYGKDAILEYVQTLSGGPTWDTVRDRDRIDMVWVRPDRGLAKRMLEEPGWRVLYRDSVSVLYGRKPGDSPGPRLTSSSRP